MKVLVADKLEELGLNGLRDLGVEVLYEPDLKDQALREALHRHEPEVLVVRSTKVTAEMMDAPKLALIIRAGAGYNTIDVAAASEHGIFVSNCPGKNAQAVAELAFGLLIACDRHIAECVVEARNGCWNKKKFSKARGLYGRTLGLVGMGKIGQEMITRAKAFGMNVVAFSRWMTPDVAAALGIGRAGSLLQLAAMCDFVSVHVSLTPETRSMIGREFFEALPQGAVFVNTSRAEVVDEEALIAALDSGRISAGLDVFAGEPEGAEGALESPLLQRPNVVITHHIGASTEQAQEAVALETVRIIREFRQTGHVPNVVNVQPSGHANHVLIVRHADRVGALAHILGVLKDEGVSVQEMENIVLGGAKAAIAQMSVDKEPSPACIAAIVRHPDVFDASVVDAQPPVAARS